MPATVVKEAPSRPPIQRRTAPVARRNAPFAACETAGRPGSDSAPGGGRTVHAGIFGRKVWRQSLPPVQGGVEKCCVETVPVREGKASSRRVLRANGVEAQ